MSAQTKRKGGIVGEGKVLTHVGRNKAYVTLSGRFVRWSAMVEDAWGDDGRPEPSYPDGRVVTLDEWWAELRAKMDS